MINETYTWSSGKRYISPEELEQIKENMQKVPEIQAKSDAYHQKEELKAEIEFEQAQKNIKNTEEIIETKKLQTNEAQKSRRQKLYQKIKNLYFSEHHDW